MEQFAKAQGEDISIVYVAWAKNKKTSTGLFPLEPSHNFNLADFVKIKKQYSQSGRCLHYESGQILN